MDAKQTPISQIYQVLQKLLGLHRQLLETVRMEREALASADLKGIREAAYAKEALIETIRQQESIRLKALGELSSQWKRPMKDLSLPNLIIAVQASDAKFADQLRSAYNALTILIQRISEQNRDNRELIETSLTHIQAMKKNVLGEASPRSDTYTQQGQKATQASASRLLSKEA